MATEELKKETLSEGVELKEKEQVKNPAELLQSSIDGLDKLKFGGFQLLKGLIKGVERMDPKKKATKNIFLNDSSYATQRKSLKAELNIWLSLLENGEADPIEVKEACEEQRDKVAQRLSDNLTSVHEELTALETAYRALDAFFANAGQGKVDCLTVMNVNKEELTDNDSDDTIAVREELEKHYDRLSLKDNYSLFVIPGYLGDADNVRMWAQTAYRNKVILLTDFKDSQDFSMLKDELDDAELQGQDGFLANTVMTANYILGRKKSDIADEEDDLYIPASGALAGRMSNTEEVVISQGVAGKKFGTFNGVKGARMELRKSQIASIIDEGVVPIVEEDGRVMAFSNRSLYNGATIGLQEYPIVRVFDWIGKVFQNFFNDEAYQNWSPKVKRELTEAIHYFLSDYKGPGKLIENYEIKKLDQDPVTKDIKINVELKPFFAAKNFYIELTGHDGNAGEFDWDKTIGNV